MKNTIRTIYTALLFMMISISAHAFKASPFKGLYEVLSEKSSAQKHAMDKKYVVIDVDTLEGIWAKYADGPLPSDLEKYKDEPSILVGFTFRNTIFLSLERGAMIGDGYLSLRTDEDVMELVRSPSGYRLAVSEKGQLSVYELSTPGALPIFPQGSKSPLINVLK